MPRWMGEWINCFLIFRGICTFVTGVLFGMVQSDVSQLPIGKEATTTQRPGL